MVEKTCAVGRSLKNEQATIARSGSAAGDDLRLHRAPKMLKRPPPDD